MSKSIESTVTTKYRALATETLTVGATETKPPQAPDTQRMYGGFGIQTIMFATFGLLFSIFILFVAALQFFGIPFTDINGEYQERQNQAMQSIELLADHKKEELMRWLEELRFDLAAQSEVPDMAYMIRLKTLIDNPEPADANMWREIAETEEHKLITRYLQFVTTTYDVYSRIDITDLDTGQILVSTDLSNLGSSHELDRVHINQSTLHQTPYIEVRETQESSLVMLIHKELIPTESRAVVVMYVALEDLIDSVLHVDHDLGYTGEVVLVDNQVLTLKKLRHPLSDGSIAPQHGYKIDALPAYNASQGIEGILRSVDYRGEEVLAASRHIPISLDLEWGMVVKKDLAEVLAPYYASLYRESITIILGLVVMLLLSYFFASRLARPITNLSNITKQVADGDFGTRAQNEGPIEIRMLSDAFNTMLENIEHSLANQEFKIEERTSELRERNVELAATMKRLEDSQQRMMQSEKLSSLGTLMAGVSHEINNPLMGVMLHIEYAEGKVDDPKLKDVLAHATRDLNRLKDILSSMSVFSQDSSKAEAVSVEEVVSNLIDIVGADFRHSETEIKLTIPESLPLVRISKGGLHQILLNLLLNAHIAVQDKDVKLIHLSAYEESGLIVVEVKDTGHGISKELRNKIFDPFFTTRPVGKGTGLGLFVSRKVTELFGGKLTLGISDDEGAVFQVHLEPDSKHNNRDMSETNKPEI